MILSRQKTTEFADDFDLMLDDAEADESDEKATQRFWKVLRDNFTKVSLEYIAYSSLKVLIFLRTVRTIS